MVAEPLSGKIKPDILVDSKAMLEKLDGNEGVLEANATTKVDANCEIKNSG